MPQITDKKGEARQFIAAPRRICKFNEKARNLILSRAKNIQIHFIRSESFLAFKKFIITSSSSFHKGKERHFAAFSQGTSL